MADLLTPLDLRAIDNGRKAMLLAPFRVQSDIVGIVAVPAGFVTDFNSVPRGLWNILPPWEYPEAGVVHDKLYRDARVRTLGSRGVTRSEADAVHREILTILDAPTWKRRAMWTGLRLGGWLSWNRSRERDHV